MIGAAFISFTTDNTFETELGVLDVVLEFENPVGTVSVSILIVVLFEKSSPLFIGAVVSVDWKGHT